MRKTIMFCVFVAIITFSVTAPAIYGGRQGASPASTQKVCAMVAVVSNVDYNFMEWNGYASGTAAFYCSGNGTNKCVANMFYHLWYEYPSGWELITTNCTDVSLACGGTTTLYPNLKNLASSVPGNYYFEVTAVSGSCANSPGTVMSYEGVYFTIFNNGQ